jgi:hypothetical protein
VKYIIKKFVTADTVAEALAKEPSVPVHDIYLKEGEEPSKQEPSLIGFTHPEEPSMGFIDEPRMKGK